MAKWERGLLGCGCEPACRSRLDGGRQAKQPVQVAPSLQSCPGAETATVSTSIQTVTRGAATWHRKGNVACCMRGSWRGAHTVAVTTTAHAALDTWRVCILRNDARQRNPKHKRTRHGQARRPFARARAHTHACTRARLRTRLRALGLPHLHQDRAAACQQHRRHHACNDRAVLRLVRAPIEQQHSGGQVAYNTIATRGLRVFHADYASITRLPVRAANGNLISTYPGVRTAWLTAGRSSLCTPRFAFRALIIGAKGPRETSARQY